MYFVDFRANFAFFDDYFVYWIKWVLKRPFLLGEFLDNNWLPFCGYEIFLLRNMTKK